MWSEKFSPGCHHTRQAENLISAWSMGLMLQLSQPGAEGLGGSWRVAGLQSMLGISVSKGMCQQLQGK